jgi:hypothetical protein
MPFDRKTYMRNYMRHWRLTHPKRPRKPFTQESVIEAALVGDGAVLLDLDLASPTFGQPIASDST